MRKRWRLVFLAPLAILGLLLLIFIGGEVVSLLWNWLLPPLFGWREITVWQAIGILALCRILFGGHIYRPNSRRRSHEERERFRQAMRERFGVGPSTSETKEL